MKQAGRDVLGFFKDLLPNLVASGLWESLKLHAPAIAGGVAGTALAGPGLVSVGAALACVTAYVGLKRITRGPDEQYAADLKAALEVLRSGSEGAEEELKNLGFDLNTNFQNVHVRMTQLDSAVAGVAELLKAGFADLDERLEQHFQQNRNHLDDVWVHLCEHFLQITNQLDRIETIAGENRDALTTYGFVPLVASNVPPVPRTFVQRPAPFAKLIETLWKDECASLVGRAQAAAGGGYGKTVLAYHYAAVHRKEHYPGGVYKVACEGATIAQALDQLLPPHEGVKGLSSEERARIVRTKLSGDNRALLILDNIDSAAQWRQYRDSGLLPTPPCHVLITTRADDIHDLPAVSVDKLEETEAVELLAKYRPSARDPHHAAALAAILRDTERVAAIVAAVGMAMAEDHSDDWAAYAAWLASAKPDELPDAGAWVASYTDYPHQTPAILDDLRRRLGPATLRALDYAALLPADMIARGWLEALLAIEADPSRGTEALDLGQDTRSQPRAPAWHIQRLRERDLLRPASPDGTLWSLHRLHRKRAHDHLAACTESKRAMLLAIAAHAAMRASWLGEAAEDNAERWVKRQHRWELAPLQALVDQSPVLDFDHADVAYLMNAVAYLLRSLGRSAEALPQYEVALEMRQRLFPGDHPDVARSLNNVALCLQSLGRSAEALPKYESALDMRQRLFPGDHPSVASSLNNVAYCLNAMGHATEALPKYEAALEMFQRLFPGDHPNVATSLNNVASCLTAMGYATEALPKYEASLEIVRRLFPGDHPDVASSVSNVASCLQSLGRSAEALPKSESALEMCQRLFPGDHPDVANSLNNVAGCLESLGRPAEALPKCESALEMCQRLFPGDHPYVALSLNNVASCLESLGRSADALPKFESALEMFRRILPFGHAHTLYPQIGLAGTLTTVRRYVDAEPLLRDAAEQCDRSEASRRLHGASVLEQLVRLYESWHTAEPDKGHDKQAAEWRARLSK